MLLRRKSAGQGSAPTLSMVRTSPRAARWTLGVCLTTKATSRWWILALPAFYNATNNCCQQLPASSHFSASLLRLLACSSVKMCKPGVRWWGVLHLNMLLGSQLGCWCLKPSFCSLHLWGLFSSHSNENLGKIITSDFCPALCSLGCALPRAVSLWVAHRQPCRTAPSAATLLVW